MRRILARRATLAAVLLATLAAPLGPAAAQAGAASPGQPAGAVAPASPRAAVPVWLITGERLLAGPGNTVAMLPAPAAAGSQALSFAVYGCSAPGGSRAVRAPVSALPYLGHGLDPGLFSVSALEHAERGGRLPVSISYRGPLPDLPGITITSRGHSTAAGYLTGASAQRFGAALGRQFRTDHTRGSYGTDGLFAHGLSIGLPGTRPARTQPARPDYPMQTLTVHGTSPAGRPDTGDSVLVFNVDNCNRLNPDASQVAFNHGTAKLSVPTGHYWAIGWFGLASERLAVLPQFTVTGPTTVAVNARSATARVGFTTPRPATTLATTFTLLRTAHGHTEAIQWLNSGGTLRVSPAGSPPATGTLQAYTAGTLSSPAGQHGTPYLYSLNFAARPGTIPSSLHYTAHPAALATVQDRYYQDTPSTGVPFTGVGTPAEASTVGWTDIGANRHMPGRQTEYLSASPPMLWASGYLESLQTLSGGQNGPLRLLHAGQRVTADWGRYPLHATPNAVLPGTAARANPMLPTAARATDRLAVDITPFGDNQPGDTGAGYGGSCATLSQCTGRYTLYQDGTKIASGDAVQTFPTPRPDVYFQAKLSPRPAQLKLVLTASRAADSQYKLSATSRDVWTWHTRRPSPAATVPAPWVCNGQLSRHCAVQPMLMLRYQVAGLSMSGTTRPGRQVIGIGAAPLQPAPATRITGTSMTVSYDGGKTWHTAHVARVSGGQFRATFTAPASTPITLRTHATGSNGGSVTETITSAYETAS